MRNKQKAAIVLATTLGTGYCPIAPGTVGAFVTAIVLWFLSPIPWWSLLSIAVAAFFLGVVVARISDAAWGSHDSGRINWDEVVGMMVTLVALPKTPAVFTAAFLLFRFFDIVKPFPVRQAEKLPHGWGVMGDDVLAGIYSNIVLQLVFRLFL
ncbi:phosphatidylglycerophosphatase A [candidate division KSB1 bacterium]|nr:phosphatidylglycerophosphatase A [candidate division KSB1 bacterium]